MNPSQGLLTASLALGLVVLSGCASTPVIRPVSPHQVRQYAATRGVDNAIVPYAVSAEMIDWLRREVPSSIEREKRLQVLAERLLAKDGRGINYDRTETGTAEEVFYGGNANCLAFTHLFVGLARELKMPVFFLTVRDYQQYEKDGDLVVISDHIAVGYGPRHEMQVIDFAADRDPEYRKILPISDITATALFYSNRGAEQLRKGNLAEAFGWLDDAVAIDPTLAVAWVNRGVVLRRLDRHEEAERSYREALELDPEGSSAYHNLAALLRIQGSEEEAASLLGLLDRSGNRNPYSYVALGDLSLRYGRPGEASRYYKRAIRLHKDVSEPLAALGQLELKQGRADEARKWLERAMRIDAEDPRVKQLATALDRQVSSR
jgi:Flp pilus assembly protein TadD